VFILGLNLLSQELISSNDIEIHIRKIFRAIVKFIVFCLLSIPIASINLTAVLDGVQVRNGRVILLRTKIKLILLKYLAHTSQKTHFVWVMKTSQLILCGEIIIFVLRSTNKTRILCGQNVDFLNVKTDGA
jgi:hypothetical protein